MSERFRLNPFVNKPTRSARTWLTLGTAAAYAAVSLTRTSPTWAQNANTPNTKPREQQTLSVHRLEIPAGPLDSTIAAYQRITGIDVTYNVPAETVAGFKSPGVTGLYSEDQALRAILAGTGLSYRIYDDGKATISVTSNEAVLVQDSRPQLSLDRFPVPLLDTPHSISTISQATIHED